MPWVMTASGKPEWREPQARPASIPIGPQNPTAQFAVPQAQAELAAKQASVRATMGNLGIAGGNLALKQREVNGTDSATSLAAAKEGFIRTPTGNFVRDPNFRPLPSVSAEVRKAGIEAFNDAVSFGGTLAELKETYKNGPGSTSGLNGLRDFLPFPRNKAFDTSANQVRGYAKKAQGTTGGEVNTIAEMQMNIGAFIPSSRDYNEEVQSKFNGLENERAKSLAKTTAILGGFPDANGRITPVPDGYTPGEFPELDAKVARAMNRVPMEKRGQFMLQEQRKFLQANPPPAAVGVQENAPKRLSTDDLLRIYGGGK